MTSAGVEEPERFSEPALYLIRPDSTVYSSSVQTMPFARLHFSDILACNRLCLEEQLPDAR
jgi:hypothetical protein